MKKMSCQAGTGGQFQRCTPVFLSFKDMISFINEEDIMDGYLILLRVSSRRQHKTAFFSLATVNTQRNQIPINIMGPWYPWFDVNSYVS